MVCFKFTNTGFLALFCSVSESNRAADLAEQKAPRSLRVGALCFGCNAAKAVHRPQWQRAKPQCTCYIQEEIMPAVSWYGLMHMKRTLCKNRQKFLFFPPRWLGGQNIKMTDAVELFIRNREIYTFILLLLVSHTQSDPRANLRSGNKRKKSLTFHHPPQLSSCGCREEALGVSIFSTGEHM